MLLKPARDGQRVLAMARHAQGQRLQPVDDEERVHRRDGRPQIAQRQHARRNRKGEIAEGLRHHHAVIGRVRLGQRRIAAALDPIEGAAIDENAAKRVALPAHEFRQRVQHDVRAMLLRPEQVGRGQRVIDQQRNAGLLGHRRNRRHVEHDAAGVGDGLDEDELGLGRDRRFEARRVVAVRPDHVPAELLEGMVELVDRAAIELPRGDELVAGLQQHMEGQQLRRVARSRRQRRRAAFERRHARLQHRLRRVHDARVDVAEGFEIEQRGRVLRVVEDIGGGLINRRDARARGGVGLGAGMDRERVEAWRRCSVIGDLPKSSRQGKSI